MATDAASRPLPPYVPFETKRNFIAQLAATVVPTHIDKGMMPTLSGATQSHLMSALRSMDLIDATGQTSQKLKDLVAAYGTESWSDTLANVVRDYYGSILGGLDVTTATAKQLRDKFGESGMDGSMADRAIRFFIRAMEESKIPFSPHLRVRRKGTRRQRLSTSGSSTADQGNRGSNPASPETPINPATTVTPEGMIRYPLHFRRDGKVLEGVLIVPNDATESDCMIVEAQLKVVRIFAGVPAN